VDNAALETPSESLDALRGHVAEKPFVGPAQAFYTDSINDRLLYVAQQHLGTLGWARGTGSDTIRVC
jgi:hypothetical protein